MINHRWFSECAEETFQIGKEFGATLTSPCVIAFSGDLGAGKTTFVRGIACSLGIDPHSVCSPTFTYLNSYVGDETLYHFDLYRIPNAESFFSAGFDDFLNQKAICCIEWSERIETLLKDEMRRVVMTIVEENKREICLI